ncbi:condensation domain-containing protein [Enterococcus rotai]|uniref:condensation domain-containing protein n=1 Tax=Enterococcus rotai TaxID=118060 RepID=UPI0032B37DFF
MEIKMTEVQKAYLLGRNESFDAKTGTHMYLEVKYQGDIQKFQDALNKVIQVQPMLRAKIKNMETFEIVDNLNYEMMVYSKSSDEMKSFREVTRERLSHKLYQSSEFPLYTFEAVKNIEDPSKYIIFISIDLLIADGLSLFQLFDDIKRTVKNDRLNLKDVSDLLLEINDSYLNSKKSARYEKDREYWKQKIETLPDAPNLLVKEEKVSHSKFARKEHIYTAEKLSKLKEIAEKRKISLNSLFLTLYSTALQQWSENKEFTINVTTFKRPRGEKYLSVIGDFTSTVLVPTNVDVSKTILENTIDIHRNIFSSFRRSSFEGIEVLRELKKHSRQPLMHMYLLLCYLILINLMN